MRAFTVETETRRLCHWMPGVPAAVAAASWCALPNTQGWMELVVWNPAEGLVIPPPDACQCTWLMGRPPSTHTFGTSGTSGSVALTRSLIFITTGAAVMYYCTTPCV
jgi:hypothetical protein